MTPRKPNSARGEAPTSADENGNPRTIRLRFAIARRLLWVVGRLIPYGTAQWFAFHDAVVRTSGFGLHGRWGPRKFRRGRLRW